MGNSNGQANDMVSVYLNYGDQKASEGWHVCAQLRKAPILLLVRETVVRLCVFAVAKKV
jgi:hypothetical protein